MTDPATEPGDCSHQAPREGAQPRARLGLYAALTCLLALLSGYHQVLAVFRDVLQEYYGLSVPQLGFTLSVGMLPAGIVSLIAGGQIKRWGARPVLRVSLLGLGAGLALAAAGQLWGLMLIAVALTVSFYNALYVASQAYLAELFPSQRRRLLSLYLAMMSVGGIAFPLWAEFMLSIQESSETVDFSHVLHVPFAVVSGIVLLGALAYHQNSPSPPRAADDSAASPWQWVRLPGGSLLLLVVMIILGTCDTAVSLWMPRVLGSESSGSMPFGIKPGHVMALHQLAYVVSRVSLSFIPDRHGRAFLMTAPGLIGGAIFLAGILSGETAAIAFTFVLGALVWSIQLPSVLAALSERTGDRFGWVLSLFMVSMSIGGFAMTNLMGGVGNALGEARLWTILLIPAVGYPAASAVAVLSFIQGRPTVPRGNAAA